MKFSHRNEPRRPRPRPTREVLRPVEEESDITFDPELVVSSKMREELRIYATEAGTIDTAAQARFIFLTLFPKRKSEVELDPERRQEHLERLLVLKEKNIRSMWHASITAEHIAHCLMAFPEYRHTIQSDSKVWDALSPYLNNFREENDWECFANFASYLLMIYPEKRDQLGLDESTRWQNMQYLESMRGVNWLEFVVHASALALLYPGHRSELGIDTESWDSIIPEYHASPKKRAIDVMPHALNLYILAAGRPEITSRGELRFTPTPKKIRQSIAVPQRPHL